MQRSHFKQKSLKVSFTRPLLRRIYTFYPLQPQFSQNYSSQALKFENISSQDPSFSGKNFSSQIPHMGNQGRTCTPVPEKKMSAPGVHYKLPTFTLFFT